MASDIEAAEIKIEGEGVGVYANLCGVVVSDHDVSLHFLQSTGPGTARSVVKVYTSIEHAKQVVVAIYSTIAKHEEQVQMKAREAGGGGEEE